jgi:hypothetical protein
MTHHIYGNVQKKAPVAWPGLDGMAMTEPSDWVASS